MNVRIHLEGLRKDQSILDDPGFDQAKALENHRRLLQKRMERLTRLLKTVDKTIETYGG